LFISDLKLSTSVRHYYDYTLQYHASVSSYVATNRLWPVVVKLTLFPGSIRKFLDLRYTSYRGRFRNWLHLRTHTKRCHTFDGGRL